MTAECLTAEELESLLENMTAHFAVQSELNPENDAVLKECGQIINALHELKHHRLCKSVSEVAGYKWVGKTGDTNVVEYFRPEYRSLAEENMNKYGGTVFPLYLRPS